MSHLEGTMKFPMLAAAAALLGCAGSAQAANIEFWYGNTGKVEEAIVKMCEGFNASQTKHKLTCVGQGSYELVIQKAIAAYRAKKPPLLIQFMDAGTLDIMLSDAVVPVQDIDKAVDWNSFIPGERSYYETRSGKLYAQPLNASTLLFYANKTLLDKAGVVEMPKTWEQVVAAARKLKESGVSCPYALNAEPWVSLEQFSARHGLPIATKHNGYDGLDAEYVFNTTLAAKHLANLVEWRNEGLMKLGADTKAGNYAAAFRAGECAMTEGSSGLYSGFTDAFADKYKLSVDMAPMYEGHDRYNTFVGGASIYVMKGHSEEEIDGAKAFLSYVRQPEQQLTFAAATGYVPVTSDALDAIARSPDKAKFATAPLGIASMSAPSTADTRGIRLGSYIQFRQVFTEETDKAFAGQQSMQTALDRAKKRGDEQLRRFAQTYKSVELP